MLVLNQFVSSICSLKQGVSGLSIPKEQRNMFFAVEWSVLNKVKEYGLHSVPTDYLRCVLGILKSELSNDKTSYTILL